MNPKLPDDEPVTVDETDREAARRALARNLPNLEEGSPEYAAFLEVLAELHKRCGADSFELRYNLRPPKDRTEECQRQFMQGQITKAECGTRLKADAERPIDLEMLTTFHNAYEDNLSHYSAALQKAILGPEQADTSARQANETAIDEHIAVLRGKLPLYCENLETVFDFLEEQRITSGAGLVKLGKFEGTSAHWLAQLIFTRITDAWESCKDVSERSHRDPRYLYAAKAIDLFSQLWLPTFPTPQSIGERLREEFILARAALKHRTVNIVNDKIRILFLAANPKNSNQLRLDEEIREIQTKIRAAEFRDSFELISRWAVRPLDLLQALNEVKPQVVHFSGHGSSDAGLVLEENDGTARPVSETAIAALFESVKDDVRLVLLNACDSASQARAISKHIECTVGMKTTIGDEAAIAFASNFYGALAFGRSVGQAFEQGRIALMLQGIPEESTPVLLTKPGADSLAVSLIHRTPVNPVLPPIALEILQSAVASNSPINYVRQDGGIAIVAGARQFDCKSDLEEAARLDYAITTLVQIGWLKQIENELYHVTHAGYEAARQISGQSDHRFPAIAKNMRKLIAEMKTDLTSENGKFVREFFVLPTRTVCLGGSAKPRFIYYEEDHENLRGQLDILENHGYLIDVTPKNTPIYRMTEDFVRLVLQWV